MSDREDALPWEVLLPRVGAAVERCHRAVLAAHDLSPTGLALLDQLARLDPATASGPAGQPVGLAHRELAALLGRTPATLTPVVDALAAAGSIRRDRDPADRRVVRVSITGAGRERLHRAAATVAVELPARLPVPPARHAGPVRDYLLGVLAALDDRAEL